jgi:flagellar export protein FliJ
MRRAQESMARMALATANQLLSKNIELRDRLLTKYAEMPKRGGIQDYGDYVRERQQLEFAERAVALANNEVGIAASNVATSQIRWIDARRQVAVLDRLDERRRSEYRIELDRQDVKEIDDIVAARYASNGHGYIMAQQMAEVGADSGGADSGRAGEVI